MAIAEPIFPFRWDISQPAQLGNLPLALPEFLPQVEQNIPGFQEHLRNCSVKILAASDNADLYFVGRSPENIYDYMRGILYETAWVKRLHLLHFSMFYHSEDEVRRKFPQAIEHLRTYLAYLDLSPGQIINRKRPIALVDLVNSGRTMGRLVKLILNWGSELNYDRRHLASKIRVVSIIRSHTPLSPGKPYPWQQEADWISLLGKSSIKNVAVWNFFWAYLADFEPKLTTSFTPATWSDPGIVVPDYAEAKLKALQLAIKFFTQGREAAERRYFARQMNRERAMRYRWYRQILNQLN